MRVWQKRKNKLNFRMGVLLLIAILLATAAFGFAENGTGAADTLPTSNGETVGPEEAEVMKTLLSINAEIETLKSDLEKTKAALEDYDRQIEETSASIEAMAGKAEDIKSAVGSLLAEQQKRGAASFLDVLFHAEDMNDLFNRLNLLRDFNRAAVNAMDALKTAEQALSDEKQALLTLREEQATKQAEQAEQLAGLQSEADRLETYLSSLKEERSRYEAYLATMQRAWETLKPVFSATIEEINRLIAENALSDDAVRVEGSLFSPSAYIDEGPFNQTWANVETLPQLNFEFTPDEVVLSMQDYEVVLHGQFEIISDQMIQFNVTAGTFMGVEMDESTLGALFSEGDLVFDLSAVLGKNGIKSIQSGDGYLKMEVIIRWF